MACVDAIYFCPFPFGLHLWQGCIFSPLSGRNHHLLLSLWRGPATCSCTALILPAFLLLGTSFWMIKYHSEGCKTRNLSGESTNLLRQRCPLWSHSVKHLHCAFNIHRFLFLLIKKYSFPLPFETSIVFSRGIKIRPPSFWRQNQELLKQERSKSKAISYLWLPN